MSHDGKVEVSPQAVATVVAQAVSECYGVVGMAPRTFGEALLTALRRPPATKGIYVRLENDTIGVDVHVVIDYGTRIVTVAGNVVSAVRFRLEQALGPAAIRVHVYVENVRVGPRNP